MISVVIPVYNVELYLEECVESVLNQTYFDLQVILVDDGSTDSSGSFCDNLGLRDRRITVIHKANGGLSDARNIGTAAAMGEFIFYLDSDDYLDTNAIKILADAQTIHDADVVIGNYFYTYGDHEEEAISEMDTCCSFKREEAIKHLMIGKIQTFAWGKLIKADIAKKHQFPVGTLFEDHFWTHLVFQDSDIIAYAPQPIVHYRQRESSISYTFTESRLDIIKGWETRIAFLRKEYPEILDVFMERCANDTVTLAWLILTRMKAKQIGFKRLKVFIEQYGLEEYSTGYVNKLIWALKKGRIYYSVLALLYKIEGKI